MYNVANNNLLSENNLFLKWTKRVEETMVNDPSDDGYFQKIAKTLAGNIFKKTTNDLKTNSIPVNKDDFTELISDIVLLFQTIISLIALISFLYFTFFLLKRLFKKFFNSNSHITPPDTFVPNSMMTIRKWLADMDQFFEAADITNEREKCSIVLSKCNDTTKRSLMAFDRKCKVSYGTLVYALNRIYKEHVKSSEEFVKMFCSLTQDNCGTINNFYIELEEWSDLAFPSISNEQRLEIIEKRFIEGLTNDNLRAAIKLARQKPTNWFTKRFKKEKSILELALELNDIYNPKESNVNYTQYNTAGPNTQCYRCANYGHFGRDCPTNKNTNDNGATPKQNQYKRYKNQSYQPNQNSTQSSTQNTTQPNGNSQTQKVNHTIALRAVDYSNSITGWCKVDEKFVRFMADTGASKTVIDSKLLDSNQTDKLKETSYKVKLADGSIAKVKGLLDCVISLNNKPLNIEILVIENLPEGCLLGYDFLKNHPMTKTAISDLKQVMTASNENHVSIQSVNVVDQTTSDSS